MAITVALMESETAGNIGAIARVMKNFGCASLILISPKADHLGKEASDRAKYAKDILQKAKVMTSEAFFSSERKKFLFVVGTSAKTGTSYNMKRNPLSPRTLSAQLLELNPKKNICLLFGREGIGLTNEEIEKCDLLVTIPSSPSYPVLNVSSAVACILYEIFAARAESGSEEHTLKFIQPPSAKEREQLILLSHDAIDSLNFFTPQKYTTQRVVWKKLFGKAAISRREAFALMGFFRKVMEKKVSGNKITENKVVEKKAPKPEKKRK